MKKGKNEERVFQAMAEIEKEFFPIYYGEKQRNNNQEPFRLEKSMIDDSIAKMIKEIEKSK